MNKARTSRKVFAPLLRNTRYGKVKIYDAWYDGNNNGVAGLYIHHKVLAINGRWFGSKGTKVVYTGSQNYTEEGNRVNDELIAADPGQRDVQPLRAEPELRPGPRHQGTDHHRAGENRRQGRRPVAATRRDGQGRVVRERRGSWTLPMIDDDGFQRPAGRGRRLRRLDQNSDDAAGLFHRPAASLFVRRDLVAAVTRPDWWAGCGTPRLKNRHRSTFRTSRTGK